MACRLGIPFYVFNLTDDFDCTVVRPFAEGYRRGITPNPCLDCNRFMKFGKLWERAKILACDRIVTGHYARIQWENGAYVLKKALDESKDQSYVLYFLTQAQLAHTLFPLGNLTKSQVRGRALENGFINARKHDSQDICFAPDGDYARVVEAMGEGGSPVGSFIAPDGTDLGKHRGIAHYTVGQRRGLGIASGEPLYVCRIDGKSGHVYLGRAEDLFSHRAYAGAFHWIDPQIPKASFRCKAKIRYRQPEQWVTVTPEGEDAVSLFFDTPQRAITPGQAAVLYEDDRVLGGGILQPLP